MTLDEIEEKIRTLCGSAPTQDGHVRGDVEAACDIALALVGHVRALENVTRMTDDRAFERITALEERANNMANHVFGPAELGLDGPWPLRALVDRLARGCIHLLNDHDCDAHGYETLVDAVTEADQRFELGLSLPAGWKERRAPGGVK